MMNEDNFRRNMKFIEELLQQEQKSDADLSNHERVEQEQKGKIIEMADRIILHKLGKRKEEEGTF